MTTKLFVDKARDETEGYDEGLHGNFVSNLIASFLKKNRTAEERTSHHNWLNGLIAAGRKKYAKK